MAVLVEGPNYRIIVEALVASCTIWSRPDVDLDTGARFAEEILEHFKKLSKSDAIGMVLDLTRAPPVIGPKTEKTVGEMLAQWENAGRRVAVVSSGHSIQQLQMRRIVANYAPNFGSLFLDERSAIIWVRGVSSSRPEKRSS